jgi:hypothetical protein
VPLHDRRRFVVVVAVLLATASLSACAKPEKPGVALKEVGVDLVYGKKVDIQPGATEGGVVGGNGTPVGVTPAETGLEPDLTPRSSGRSGPPAGTPAAATAPTSACPEPADDASVGEAAPPRIERPPASGDYWTRFSVPGGEARTGYRRIDGGRVAQNGTFEYKITEPFNGQSYTFRVDPKDGMFLTQIILVRDGEPVTVEPQVPLEVVNFPILTGDRTGGEGNVDSVSTDPSQRTLFVYHGKPDGKEVVTVCNKLVETWKFAWDLEVTIDGASHHEVGTVNLMTQFGGWAARSELEVSGAFREAKETISALRVTPGRVQQ